MSVSLTRDVFDNYLSELSKTYELYGPVRKMGQGAFSNTDVIGYDRFSYFNQLVLDQKSYFSPKEVFYPIREVLFEFMREQQSGRGINAIVPEIEKKPLLIFLRPCDLNGIRRLDTIFLKNGEADFYYERRRALVKFVLIECTVGFESCFCVSMASNKATDYEAVLRIENDAIIWHVVEDTLKHPLLEAYLEQPFEVAFIQENQVTVEVPPLASITNELFNHPLWTEYTQRCIACGRCNTSCITCSCFNMQDIQTIQKEAGDPQSDTKVGQRRRTWTSCHVDGYTHMAGGHQFRKQNGEKMRFKTLHKINDYKKRFGEHMCVGCGRCDDVCPEYISFSKCIQKLNQLVKEDAE